MLYSTDFLEAETTNMTTTRKSQLMVTNP